MGTKQLRRNSVTHSKMTNGSVGRNDLRRRSVTHGVLSTEVRSQLAKTGATGAKGATGPRGPGAGRIRYSAAATASTTTSTALDFNGFRISGSCQQTGPTTALSIFARSQTTGTLQVNFSFDSGSDPTAPAGLADNGNVQFNLAAGATESLSGPAADTGYGRAISTVIYTASARSITVNLIAFVDADADRCSLDGTAVSS